MKAISFSLFGDSPKYLVGLEKNIALAELFYPDWRIFVYYNDTVPLPYIYKLKEKVRVINMSDSPILQSMWRFCVHDESGIERFIIRDADSRISQREVDAVAEWIESGKILHIMRDHPHHGYVIMGGMWGMIPQDFSMTKSCEEYVKMRNTSKWSMTDMDFLRDVLYPVYGKNSKVHATYAKFEPWAEDFPTKLVDKKFVGEIWQADDTRDYQVELI